jgi:hypothetical protein
LFLHLLSFSYSLEQWLEEISGYLPLKVKDPPKRAF